MEALEFFKEQGRKGGKRRAKTTTKAQRQEWGRKGGIASGKTRAKRARKKAKK